MKEKSALEIKTLLGKEESNFTFLAQITAEMLKLCRDEKWSEILDLTVGQISDLSSLKDSQFGQFLVTSVAQPRLFCYDQNAKFPGIYDEKKVEFYSKVRN